MVERGEGQRNSREVMWGMCLRSSVIVLQTIIVIDFSYSNQNRIHCNLSSLRIAVCKVREELNNQLIIK